MKNIKRKILPLIISFSALSVSASAAYYSISGLSKLFAGASIEVIIMATSLEVAKLVIATLLYQYWAKLNKLLKFYLTVAATVLVLITSIGIYGFLSGAYQNTATKTEIADSRINVLESKKGRFEENRTFYLNEKTQLDKSIGELRNGLSNNVIQYTDKETGQLITTTSSSNRKVLQNQLDDAISRRDIISKKLDLTMDSISNLEIKIVEINGDLNATPELGPLKYLSELTGYPMNRIINWLLLTIIFVFDPLAIALVISANFAFNQLRKKQEENIIVDSLIDNENNQENISSQDIDDVTDKVYDDEQSQYENMLTGNYDLTGNTITELDDLEEIEDLDDNIEPHEDEKDVIIEKLKDELKKTNDKLNKKSIELNGDLLEKINKLSEVIDLESALKNENDKKDIETDEEKKSPIISNKKVITYQKRDGGRNFRTDRI